MSPEAHGGRSGRQELTRSLTRALKIMETLEESGKPLGVTEIARRIGVHKSSVYRLVRTMVEFDFLEQHTDSAAYWLGAKLSLLGDMASLHLELPKRVRPHVERLAQLTRETANFVKLQGYRCLYLVSIPTDQSIGMIARPYGATDGIHCTAVGKAILAFVDPARAENLLGRVPFVRRTAQTLTTPDQVLQELPTVRANGYAVDDQENEEHVRCIGSPVFDADGTVVGGVSISGPDFRIDDGSLPDLATQVIRCAVDVSAGLGLPGRVNPLMRAAGRQ